MSEREDRNKKATDAIMTAVVCGWDGSISAQLVGACEFVVDTSDGRALAIRVEDITDEQ